MQRPPFIYLAVGRLRTQDEIAVLQISLCLEATMEGKALRLKTLPFKKKKKHYSVNGLVYTSTTDRKP